MNWTGKIIGMTFGFLFGGPIGLLIGLVAGHILDQNWLRRLLIASSNRSRSSKVQPVFFNSTFRIMGYIAKSDGRVSENEIRQARHIMQQMGLDEHLKQEAIRLFTQGKEQQFNLSMTIAQLRAACAFQPALLRIFMEMQVQVAYADGRQISQRKREVLQHIFQQLGISSVHFSQFEQRFRGENNYRQQQQNTPYHDPRIHLHQAYQMLGLSQSANDAEIKKAYRRLMSRHHPDKLIAKGLPPEMIKMATQKTQQIKNAYEQICKARKVHA